jgi:hypothetical protein
MPLTDFDSPWYLRGARGAVGGIVLGTLLAIPVLLLGLGDGGRMRVRGAPDAPGLYVVLGIILGWAAAGAAFGLLRPAFQSRWLAAPAGMAALAPVYLGYAGARRLAGEPAAPADDLVPALVAAAVVGGVVRWSIWRGEARRARGQATRKLR